MPAPVPRARRLLDAPFMLMGTEDRDIIGTGSLGTGARGPDLASPNPSVSLRHALCVLGIVLLGYSAAHLDDNDAQYYARMAANIWRDGDLFHLYWTSAMPDQFNDNLPPGIWLIALTTRAFGAFGARLAYGAVTVATWSLLGRLAARHGMAQAGVCAVLLAAVTESYVRFQALPRLDAPYLLGFVAAVYVARSGEWRHLVLSGLWAGLPLVIRTPVALALFALIPAIVLVERRRLAVPLLRRADVFGGVVFLASAAVLPLAFHLADVRYGDGDWFSRYVGAQVLPSLAGARPDGDGTHFGPLRFLFHRFWPGLPLLAVALVGVRRKAFPGFLAWWMFVVIAGLSLGKRHQAHHIWPAFLPALVLAGEALASILRRFESRWPAIVVRMPLVLGVAAAAFATLLPFALPPCDVQRLAAKIDRTRLCEVAIVATESGAPDWPLANRLVDHLAVDVVFSSAAVLPVAKGDCMQLVAQSRDLPAQGDHRLLLLGERYSFFQGGEQSPVKP